jgi:catechol-2,3-dioxygenase
VPLISSGSGEDSFNFESWNAHSFYFRDPASNILECIARHNLMNGSDRPFDEQGMLCISEIGIATDDVRATVQLLEAELSAGIYDGAGSDTFAAVGDEHGLFIVVEEGRKWYPDLGRPAGPHPVTAVISTAAGQEFTLSGPPYEAWANAS